MTKTDHKEELKPLYKPPKGKVAEVTVPPLRYLMIDGKGDPNTTPRYKQAVEALFSVSYKCKFAAKASGVEYVVMPLEGLWWADNLDDFLTNNRTNWQWTMMILQPDAATDEIIQNAISEVASKKGLPLLNELRVEVLDEGRCAQTMHVGPFAEEGATIRRVHEFIESRSAMRGKHHEIYLSDIRRAKPANWKTVIRQPME